MNAGRTTAWPHESKKVPFFFPWRLFITVASCLVKAKYAAGVIFSQANRAPPLFLTKNLPKFKLPPMRVGLATTGTFSGHCFLYTAAKFDGHKA